MTCFIAGRIPGTSKTGRHRAPWQDEEKNGLVLNKKEAEGRPKIAPESLNCTDSANQNGTRDRPRPPSTSAARESVPTPPVGFASIPLEQQIPEANSFFRRTTCMADL